MEKLSNTELQRRVEELERENALLRQKIDLLVRRIFGKSSETLSPDQLELLLGGEPATEPGKADASWAEAPQEAPDHEPRSKKRRRHPKERWPEDLPVIEEVLDPAAVTSDPQAWRRIGSEVTKQLDYEPARFLRRRLIRNKYVPRHGVDVVPVIAELPAMLLERGVAAPDSLPPSSWENTAITFRSIVRKASSRLGTTCSSPGKVWPAGWNWPPIGCDPFTTPSAQDPRGQIRSN